MRMVSGYYRMDSESHLDIQKDICINSVGHYSLKELPLFRTERPIGREDYHILYVAKGRAFFTLGGKEQTAQAGEMILYLPHEPQDYHYHVEDAPDIYWIHFTGHRIPELLAQTGFSSASIYQVGTRNRYIELFDRMITELQIRREFFLEIANNCLQELVFYLGRATTAGGKIPSGQVQIIEKTLQHFHSYYQEAFSVENYAKSMNISTCWFIRSFREYTGETEPSLSRG